MSDEAEANTSTRRHAKHPRPAAAEKAEKCAAWKRSRGEDGGSSHRHGEEADEPQEREYDESIWDYE